MIYVPVQHKHEEKVKPRQNVKHNEPIWTILKQFDTLETVVVRVFFGKSSAFTGNHSEFDRDLISLRPVFLRHFFDNWSVPVEAFSKNSRRNAENLPFEGREKVEGIPVDVGTSSVRKGRSVEVKSERDGNFEKAQRLLQIMILYFEDFWSEVKKLATDFIVHQAFFLGMAI